MSSMFFPSLLAFVLLASTVHASFHNFGIPSSDATVDVRVFNIGNTTLTNETHGATRFICPLFLDTRPSHRPCMLSSSSTSALANGLRFMFNLGMRPDPLNLVPSLANYFASGAFSTPVFKGITDLLEEGGITLPTIDTGDMSKFPNSTNLVFGNGTDIATYPETPTASLHGINKTRTSLTCHTRYIPQHARNICFKRGTFVGHVPGLSKTRHIPFVMMYRGWGRGIGPPSFDSLSRPYNGEGLQKDLYRR
ncbi:hypothetical protein DFH07DRAFT_964016 [Mycena maculata]|uniref:Uncharacterized protein n=1 Tax=Mycena maculata TaxID=230809 RepID=A0AAD7II77_9AGAR|nr:hypothetical protein DFH07DRAFT_964016 [Mycena maculata]